MLFGNFLGWVFLKSKLGRCLHRILGGKIQDRGVRMQRLARRYIKCVLVAIVLSVSVLATELKAQNAPVFSPSPVGGDNRLYLKKLGVCEPVVAVQVQGSEKKDPQEDDFKPLDVRKAAIEEDLIKISLTGRLKENHTIRVKCSDGVNWSEWSSETVVKKGVDQKATFAPWSMKIFGGEVVSQERDDFSQAALFLGLNSDWKWIGGKHIHLDHYIDIRLTSQPINASKDGQTAKTSGGFDKDAFVTSRKVSVLQGGAYIPFLIPRKDNTQFFIAPIAKGGIQTITGERDTTEAKLFEGDDVYSFYSFGFRLGRYVWDEGQDRPALAGYLDFTKGEWENFERSFEREILDDMGIPIPDPDDPTKTLKATIRERPWRFGVEGRLIFRQFLIGVDVNAGKGPDDVRFLFGVEFDWEQVKGALDFNQSEQGST